MNRCNPHAFFFAAGLLFAACSPRAAGGGEHARQASGAVPPPMSARAASSVVASSPDAAASSVSASESRAHCTWARGYRGDVLSQPVFARLSEEAGQIRGRYFYAKVGVDIALRGTISREGRVSMLEGDPSKPTGRFDGSCDPASGVVQGAWEGGKARGPFVLAPVAAQDPPLVAKKRATFGSPYRGDAGSSTGCKYSEVVLEFFGVASADVERKLNHEGIEPSAGPWLAPARAEEARGCRYVGFESELDESFLGAFRGFVNIGREGDATYEGRNPRIGSEYEPVAIQTVDLTQGEVVKSRDVFAKDPMPLVKECAARGRVGENAPQELEFWTPYTPDRFWLTETGVRFWADGYPPVYWRFNEEGPLLAYAVLKRDGYLKRDSPVGRAWADIPAAPADAQACAPGQEAHWWQGYTQ